MPTFTFSDPNGKQYSVNGPEGATAEQAFQILQSQIGRPKAPEGLGANAADFAKSIPRGMVQGLLNATSGPVAPEAPVFNNPVDFMPAQERMKGVESQTGPMYQPQGRAGKFGEAIGEGLGNPLSYVGPGTLPLKIGANVLSSAGGEAAGQATEGTQYEGSARIAGALAGGAAGVKAFGPSAPKAAIPTQQELRAAADQGYNAARNSGVELNPKGFADFAAKNQQDLTVGPKYAFTGGENGTAPKTLALLDELQNTPAGAIQTPANIDTIRRRISDIAGETKEFKPTSDAKAAMVLKRQLDNYLENLPENSVVAGNPANYVQAIKQANGNYAAASRLGKVDARVDQAENSANRQIAGSLDNRIKSRVGSLLDNPKSLRGFSPEEVAQVQKVNDGTLTSNILRQLGRGGSGVVPIMAHMATAGPMAAATGGASVPLQAALAAALYGSKKTAERMTVKQAGKLAEMLAKRSPLYESRVNALPPPDTVSNKAAIIRALLAH